MRVAADGELLSPDAQVDTPGDEPAEVPSWARRAATGTSLTGSTVEAWDEAEQGRSGALLRALTRADRPDELIRVLASDGAAAAALARTLPGSAGRLMSRIVKMRSTGAVDPEFLTGHVETEVEEEARRTGRSAASLESTARTIRGFGGASRGSAKHTDGMGSSRLMKLSQRLMDLIHLAEVEKRRQQAQAQVRMSDEEVGGETMSGADGAGSDNENMNLAALQREVLDAVRRHLELEQQRREEGPNVGIWW
jgi:hypothetical protein